MNNKTKDIVIGLGEIGKPILKLLSKGNMVTGYDVNKNLVNLKQFEKLDDIQTRSLHICIPFTKNFLSNIKKYYKMFYPQCIVIHSTIQPYTTKKIQNQLQIPIIFSATRGVHKRMLFDLKRYMKFFAIEKNAPKRKWAISNFSKTMKKCGIKTRQMSTPLTLELAKIVCDTSYYGWLINYAQISNTIAKKHGIDYDEMWMFAEEINKFLGNRPKMLPGFIGGHCVIPNLKLINDASLKSIDKINSKYSKILKD